MSQKKKWHEIASDEIARATRKYDEAFAADKYFRPMPASERAAHLKSLRRGQPQRKKAIKRVVIALEQELLQRADSYAKRHGLTRSDIIAKGLETLIGSAA